MDALEQVIDSQLCDISAPEIAGAYRGLCGMMLVQTVAAFKKGRVCRNEDAQAKNYARRWVSGRPGILSFRECCEALNLDTARARAALHSIAPQSGGTPISRVSAGA